MRPGPASVAVSGSGPPLSCQQDPNIQKSIALDILIKSKSCELIIDQLVRSLVVEPTHPGSSPRLGTGARTFLDLFQDFPVLYVKW